ncbi:gamma-glutamyltransferase [Nonomuraea sp. NEAU-A123]|uniref:gamma-glutamyltransferase n=1 Tax=Nonomuraea sp. NEAU-A123 TaxID=2839649 RepID=UPI001BE3D464|nr:gamma-glutamyltransferase [Nonomuraea sp. NEAU-A123]MBT2227874.1 gamma-glutamyltransferase [Nonomuraea sp. NEAU-A123]
MPHQAGGGIAIAAPHRAGVAAAREIVAAGGGVVDAALAAAVALTVAYPHQCSIGGDLVALIRTPDGTVRAVLSMGAAAQSIDVAALRATSPRMPPGGPLTVTVPGVVAGWAALADLGGHLPLDRVLAPAVALARDGVAVSDGLARAIRARLDVVRADPGLSALLLGADGAPLPSGAALRQPALAATLEAVAADWRSFYTGEIANRLVSGLRKLGSPLRASDFAAHRAEECEPLRREAGGMTWWAAPPPSQGASLLAVLTAMDAHPDLTATTAMGARPDVTATTAHPDATRWRGQRLLAAARTAESRRDALLGDPRMGPVDLDGLLLLDTERTVDRLPSGPKPAGDTVAITAVAADGSAVTLIQSVFQSFGSGLLEPSTGVVLHNRGSAFSLVPGHPGVARPGARPPHTLCPVLGTSADNVVALGCQGGRAQPWILAQVAGDVAAARNLSALLARPRWVIGSRDLGLDDPTLVLEPGVPDADALATTARDLGLALAELPALHDDAGHVQVARLGRGGLAAASDVRADGAASVIGTGA